MPDPRRQDMCTYPARHLWWSMILTFLLRGGSRNAFDGDRTSGQFPVKIAQRLIQMRLLDSGRLLDQWWMIAIDGTLRDRGHDTQEGEAKHRYVLTASLVGPFGIWIPLMSEFMDVHDLVRHKEDCELNAFGRLRLVYGFSVNHYCNIADEAERSLPAFGPLALGTGT